MAELNSATEIALVGISGDEYFPLREDAAPGLLRLSLNRLASWLFGGYWVAPPDDGDILTWDTDHFVAAPPAGGSGTIEILDETVSVDSAATILNFTGAGVTATQTAPGEVDITIPGASGGNSWMLNFRPIENEPPTSNYATLDTRNNHPVLDFDTTTQEAAVFTGVLPNDYGGAGVTIKLFCALTTATSGTVGWDLSFERIDASSLDIDSDSFATAQTVTAVTVPGTSGQVLAMSVNISDGANMDGLVAGELFRLRVRRDVANDTAAGDAELLFVTMVEQ